MGNEMRGQVTTAGAARFCPAVFSLYLKLLAEKGAGMGLIVWKRSYETGINKIDMQHRQLVGMINELFDGMKENRGQRALEHVLDQLLGYAQKHFTDEERIMREHHYPELEHHALEHLKLSSQVLELKDRHRNGERISTPEVFSFLQHWLQDHILREDKLFVEEIKKRTMLLKG